VGSVKRCKNPKCNRIFYPEWNQKNIKYCPDCHAKFGKNIRQNVYRLRHESAKVGNSAQDNEILAFLKKKRSTEDNRYA
jgi:NAD-dependent SIR2 family protein deacetylase